MGILYVDEAGNSGLSDTVQPNFFFGGIYVKGNNWSQLEKEIIDLQNKYKNIIDSRLPKAGLLKLVEQQSDNFNFFQEFHFHGQPIINRTGLWMKLNNAETYQLLHEIIDILISNSIEIFVGRLDKTLAQENIDTGKVIMSPKQKAKEFELLMPQFIQNFENEKKDYDWVIVRAIGEKNEQNVVSKHLVSANNCCKETFIQDSKKSVFLQVSDIILWVNQAYNRIPEDEREAKSKNKEICKLYNKLQEYSHFYLMEYK